MCVSKQLFSILPIICIPFHTPHYHHNHNQHDQHNEHQKHPINMFVCTPHNLHPYIQYKVVRDSATDE